MFVIFGSRTFYSEPDYPAFQFAEPPPSSNIYCNVEGCFKDRTLITPEVEETLSDREKDYLGSQREYLGELRDYENDREDYFRNVFVVSGFFGIVAIGAAIALYRRVDAMPLGLMLGGIGSLIYGWVEWARGPDEAGTAVVFAMATVGLVVALGAGYWFLGGRQDAGPTETPKPDNR